MIQKTIYNDACGLGIVTDEYDAIYQIAKPSIVTVNNVDLIPGDKVNLDGYFLCDLVYVGVLDENENCLVFYLGNDEDLFENIFYFKCIFKVSETRIFDKYTKISGRDYNYINGQWK